MPNCSRCYAASRAWRWWQAIAPPQQDQKPVEVDARLNIGLAPGLVI
ncbi:MAG: hypothetical protein LBU76_03275 [Azoarcus sp.]|nr:hypothetical protein [Azoarcus sp.]